jgi:hypothetical protein
VTPPPAPAATPTPPAAPAARPTERNQRVAVLLDFTTLQEEARRQGGELSYRRLLRGILGERTAIRSFCYGSAKLPDAAAKALGQSGFELATCDSPVAAAVRMAVDAMSVASRVDTVVLAPASAQLDSLVQALRAQGVRVECASFEAPTDGNVPVVRLGKDCIFVP